MNWPIGCKNHNKQQVAMIGTRLKTPMQQVTQPSKLPKAPKPAWSPYQPDGNGSKATEAIHGGQPNAAPITSHSLKKTASYSYMTTPTKPCVGDGEFTPY